MSSEVEAFVAQVEAAIRRATARLGAAGLRVRSVTVAIQTTITKSADGTINVKVVELGGSAAREATQTVTVEFVPKTVDLFAGDLDEDLTTAVETIERAVAEIRHSFDLSAAEVTLRLGKTKSGTVRVLLGGSVEVGEAHEATIKLLPGSAA